jgi:hypothetical protein
MLRHSNFHVKWELLQEPPEDERLLPGMFLPGQRWGWQEKTARAGSRSSRGPTPTKRRSLAAIPAPDDDDDDDEDDDDDDEDEDDEDMN